MNTNQKPIALITGAAGGIGAACARELHSHGCKVVIHYRSNEESARKLHLELAGSSLIKADLAQESDMDELVAQLKTMGGVDILVNNAGITADSPFMMSKMSDFENVFNVNVKSTFLLTKKIAKMMMRKKQGRIINISSVVGATGNAGQSIYGMTKASLINLTRTLSVELAPYNILVNAIAPGFIQTAMTDKLSAEIMNRILENVPLKKVGRPEDVAKMVRFLALEADYCTGGTFHVNGGMYAV